MIRLLRLSTLLLVCAAAAPLAARQQSTAGQTLLQRAFATTDFRIRTFGPARWIDEGKAYTTLEPAAGRADAVEIARYDTQSGARSVLVSAAELTPKTAGAKPLVIEDYSWSSDGRRLLVFTNTKPVWRQNTRGDYWVLDRQLHSLRKLGGAAPESTTMFAKFSPDGTRVGYVRKNNIYVEDMATGKILPVTSDGSTTIVNGTSDWVYEEEFDLRDAFRWSPDGKSIAFWQFDSKGVGSYPIVYNTGKPREIATEIPYPGVGPYPTIQNFQYPLAGTTNSAARIGVVSAAGGVPRWMKVPGDPRNNYIARMEWAANSTELVLQHLNRPQNTDDVLLANATTGVVRQVLHETDAAWVDVVDDLHVLNGGKEFLWVSERDGWRHIYRVPREGGALTLVTPGAYDVVSVEAVDDAGGWVYFIASPDNPTERYLFRARLDGTGAPARLTPAAQRGTHTYQLSSNGLWAFHTRSTFEAPPATDLVSLPTHTSVRVLEANDTTTKNADAIGTPPVEFFTVPIAGGVTCDAWIMRPPNFDASKKYPVLIYVYGEPAAQTVLNSWGGGRSVFHRAAALDGYVVVSVDTRGTPGPKGRAWRKVIYGAIGKLSSDEHAAAIREMLRTRPYLDPARVAVWGWSGGGTSTLNLMFRQPDLYKVGMSVAPVPDQRLYDSIYQERYMNLPQENSEGYKSGSPINFADGLKGKLLIVHGSGDDNVHIQGTELLVNKLISLNKSFDFFVYPNRTHAISEGNGTTLHIYSLLLRYLEEHVQR